MMGHSGAVKSILKAEIFSMEPERARRKRADQVGIASATTGLAESATPEMSPGAPLSDLDEMTAAKLWNNPCWLTYRLNYLALRYNVPLYEWVERTYGLSRPEYVVIYSLGLKDGSVARDIAISSGFPQNTLSRATQKLVGLGLIERSSDDADRRRNVLRLTKAGRTLFNESLPRFVDYEHMMLEALDETERETLSGLMAKLVMASTRWPARIETDGDQPKKQTRRVE
eukprot:jgi/Tetstr1/453596/TSEL_040553.t1